MKTITIDIKAWKFNNIDQFIHKKKELTERLKCIQNSIQSRSDHGGLVKMEYKLQREFSVILKEEELIWYQRSRVKWLTDEDRNKKYCHTKTINIRRKNKIVMLKNGHRSWIEEENELRLMVNEYYKKMFVIHSI